MSMFSRGAAILAASVLVIVGVTPPASAHVTVSSPDAKPGGFAKLVFRVPTESDTASTTKLTVTLPKEHPFVFVGTQVKSGWKVTKTEQTLAQPIESGDSTVSKVVATITWTADPAGVPAGQFDEFALSVGRLPEKVDSLSFPAEQTYSDGEVVRWDQPRTGSDEPEHPAPVLKLAAAPNSQPAPAATNSDNSDDTDDSDLLARLLGGGGLVLGLAGLALGLRRRPSAPQ
jgi:periplasmic copper chaperone A